MTINLRDWSRTAAQRGWGAGWPSCSGVQTAGTAVVTADRSGTRMSWHKRIARLADLLMDETERRGFLLKPGQCGAYNCRAIAGTNSPSNHSWALAGDLNWTDNPYTTTGRHTIPQWVYDLWARYGFANGSMYSGAQDWMHFEFMGTPADADAMTALALVEIGGAAAPAVPAAATARGGLVIPLMLPRTELPADYVNDDKAWPKASEGWAWREEVVALGFVQGWRGRLILRLNFGHPGGRLFRAHVDIHTGKGADIRQWPDVAAWPGRWCAPSYIQAGQDAFEVPVAGPAALMLTYAAPGGACLNLEWER